MNEQAVRVAVARYFTLNQKQAAVISAEHRLHQATAELTAEEFDEFYVRTKRFDPKRETLAVVRRRTKEEREND